MTILTPALPRAIWVPYWIRPTLALNSLDVSRLKDLSSMSKYMSEEDYQVFIAVNNIVDNVTPNYHARQVDNLYKQDVIDRLTLSDVAEIPDSTYSVEHLDNDVFLIYVEPGFMNTLRIRSGALAFVSECLKVQYSLMPIPYVSNGLLFRQYLNLLNPKVPFFKL